MGAEAVSKGGGGKCRRLGPFPHGAAWGSLLIDEFHLGQGGCSSGGLENFSPFGLFGSQSRHSLNGFSREQAGSGLVLPV